MKCKKYLKFAMHNKTSDWVLNNAMVARLDTSTWVETYWTERTKSN